MDFIEYFACENKAHWLDAIKACEWGSARFLSELIENGTFFAALGAGSRLIMLTDAGRLAAFATLAPKDCIDDAALAPWLGFLYTFPEYRMRGCARSIVGRICALAKADGNDKLYLATDHIGLYEKMGFEYVENRMDVWGEDSRIYVKKL